ncbi:hypothetical protein K2Z83_09820 [Oscillochloris sp. ZM17-4]|uniref:hypothetical protein n=1 Tax=Oscillochloris sp. ZM17-4 TaxID=2866714 RepID=UPI001C73CC78|nr:hypothetical protein [Oscillochloris sp. ZM17-4]MBX0327971.1 hypothetical protein [Oscillochloris sp. ZM17-4]
MQTAAIILLLICYGAAGYLAWQQRTPVYLLALVAGHLSALASPLWRLLYGVSYGVSLDSVQAAVTQPVPASLILAAGWHYSLPAMLVLYLYTTRWWFPGGITGILTYLIFLLYHLLIELVGLRASLWSYRVIDLPLGLPSPLLAAIMAGLVSYGLLYVLLATYRYAWLSMALALVPAALLISLLTHGLLGAPLWIALVLNGASWAVGLGAVSALALLLWAIQIVTGGISRVE